MTSPKTETVYFERGTIRVTNHTLSTKLKDEALAPDQSIRIGRDPLWMAGIIAFGLLLFANRFGSLLFWHEQVFLVVLGITVAAAGYCTATLQIGQYMRERTVLVAPIWTINAVRRAISKARHAQGSPSQKIVMTGDEID